MIFRTLRGRENRKIDRTGEKIYALVDHRDGCGVFCEMNLRL